MAYGILRPPLTGSLLCTNHRNLRHVPLGILQSLCSLLSPPPNKTVLLFCSVTTQVEFPFVLAMEDFYDVLLNKLKEDDFYALLGCDELATTEQINAEFRQKAKLYHPDKNPGDKAAAKLFERFVLATH